MAEKITAKIVTVSRPYLVREGNSWISVCVYPRDGLYYQKTAVPPTIKHGPWEVGEELDVAPSEKDQEAEDWMVEIYNNPRDYKRIMKEVRFLEKNTEEDDGLSKIDIFMNVITALAVIAIIGIILRTFILGA